MEMTESDSDTEDADYDSSESDVGITAKFKMSWHPRSGTMVTVMKPDSKPQAEETRNGCGWQHERPASNPPAPKDSCSSDKSDSDKDNSPGCNLHSANAEVIAGPQPEEGAEIAVDTNSSDKSSSDKTKLPGRNPKPT